MNSQTNKITLVITYHLAVPMSTIPLTNLVYLASISVHKQTISSMSLKTNVKVVKLPNMNTQTNKITLVYSNHLVVLAVMTGRYLYDQLYLAPMSAHRLTTYTMWLKISAKLAAVTLRQIKQTILVKLKHLVK